MEEATNTKHSFNRQKDEHEEDTDSEPDSDNEEARTIEDWIWELTAQEMREEDENETDRWAADSWEDGGFPPARLSSQRGESLPTQDCPHGLSQN